MFVWNKMAVTQSCCSDDDVREALRLFPEKKGKAKEMFKGRKDVLGLLPNGFRKRLIY